MKEWAPERPYQQMAAVVEAVVSINRVRENVRIAMDCVPGHTAEDRKKAWEAMPAGGGIVRSGPDHPEWNCLQRAFMRAGDVAHELSLFMCKWPDTDLVLKRAHMDGTGYAGEKPGTGLPDGERRIVERAYEARLVAWKRNRTKSKKRLGARRRVAKKAA